MTVVRAVMENAPKPHLTQLGGDRARLPRETGHLNGDLGPGQCGSGGGALYCKVKGGWFNCQSGCISGLWAWPQPGASEGQRTDISLSH